MCENLLLELAEVFFIFFPFFLLTDFVSFPVTSRWRSKINLFEIPSAIKCNIREPRGQFGWI